MGATYVPVYDENNPMFVTGSVSIASSGSDVVNVTGSVNVAGGALNSTLVDGSQTTNISFSKTSAGLSSAIINFSSSGDNVVVSGLANQTIRVFKIFLITNGVTELVIKTGTTELTGPMLVANGSIILDLDSEPWFVTSTSESFTIGSSQNVQVSGRVYYTQS